MTGGWMTDPEWLEAAPEWLQEILAEDVDRRLDQFTKNLRRDPPIPDPARRIIEEYEERGAPLDAYWSFMPPELRDVALMRRFGPASRLRRLMAAVREAGDLLLMLESRDDYSVMDRKCAELSIIAHDVEEAERSLRQQGLEMARSNTLKAANTTFRRRAVVRLFDHLKPRHDVAWPEDRRPGGGVYRNPQRVQRQVQMLLRPYMGNTPLTRVRDDINNALRTRA